MKFKFGKDVLSTTFYDAKKGFGWKEPKLAVITDEKKYCMCKSYRSIGNNPVYEFPTFVVDVPNGIYNVTITSCTDGKNDAVNGAYINGWMYAYAWSTQDFATSFDEPTPSSYIYTKAGQTRVETATVAVTNQKLTIEFTSYITNDGLTGTAFISEIKIEDCHRSAAPASHATLNFLGDSTLAKYPPNDGKQWIPIPERKGWAENFAFKRFTDGNLLLCNYAIAGSSVKSFFYNGDLNRFLLKCHNGDTCIIEAGLNDTAVGRRYATPDELQVLLQAEIDACVAFGQKIILVAGTIAPHEYCEAIKAVALTNNIPFVNLMNHWSDYLYETGKTGRDLTVDGTHLRRVGAVVAARFVANDIQHLEGYSISGHIEVKNINYKSPSCVVSDLRILSQTKNSVTIGWNISEETLYNRRQLITDFNIYEVSPDGSKLVYTAPAYIPAGSDAPVLKASLPIKGGTNAYLSITCVGLTGEGPYSELVKIKSYEPTKYENLQLLINELSTVVYDKDFYTEFSYKTMQEVLALAKTFTAKSDVFDIYTELLNAKSSLEPIATCIEKTDFSFDTPGKIPWDLEGTHNYLATTTLAENGNRTLKLYVEAAGSRYLTKYFKAATNLNASKIIMAFTWYPGKPDLRNVTELEFYSNDTNRVISLKAADSAEIGFVAGNYKTDDNSYMVGSGFHDYPDSRAVNLKLPTNTWYRVKLVFNFETSTVDLYLNDTVVTDIKVNFDDCNTITKLNFLLSRGKCDNHVTNDLSILWEMQLDNFAMYYI